MKFVKKTTVLFDVRGEPSGSFTFDGWLPAHKARWLTLSAACKRFECLPEEVRTRTLLHGYIPVVEEEPVEEMAIAA